MTNQLLPAENTGTEITRFNALRHGILARYTVLPGGDATEYGVVVAALAAETYLARRFGHYSADETTGGSS